MTLDVTIGKFKIKNPTRNDVKDYESANAINFMSVVACPISKEPICEQSAWPCESYRSGSTGFWNFFEKQLPKLYKKMRFNPNTNDKDIAFIKPILKEINALPNPVDDDADRMKWLKYWCNRAVELYGIRAAIEFC